MMQFNYRQLMLHATALSLLFSSVLTTEAKAQDGSIMAVVHATDPAAQKPAAYAKYYIRNYFQADSRYDSVEIDKIVDSTANDSANKQIQVASEMVQKGREAYDNLELDQAIDFLQKAISKYERYVAFMDSTRPISDAYIALGASYILRGEEKAGKRALVKAILIDPLAKPDPRIFNPSMMEIFDESKEDAANAARGGVNVISNPGYAEVHMDGKFIGITPLSKGEIISGRHIFQLKLDGYRTFGKVIDLNAHTEESISGSLEQTSESARLRDMYTRAVAQIEKESMGDSIRELASYFKVNNIFIAGVKLDGEMVVLTGAQFDVATGQRVKLAKTTFLFDSEQFEYSIQKFMNDNFSADTLHKEAVDNSNVCNAGLCADGRLCTADADCAVIGATSNSRKSNNKAPMNSMKKIISFSSLGAGAGMMVIGGVLWGVAGAKASKLKTPEITIKMVANDLRNLQKSGKSAAVAGDCLFFIGTAAALTGGALLLFWNPDTKKSNNSTSLSGNLSPVPGGAYMSLAGTF